MKSLKETALLALIKQEEEIIKKYEESIKTSLDHINDLKDDLFVYRKIQFEEKYGESCHDVMDDYTKLMQSCVYQGGEGYRIWIGTVDSSMHMVVHPDKYKICQPTQAVRDAYLLISGSEMDIPTKTHVERWGN